MFLPQRAHRALHHYIEIERDELVQRTAARAVPATDDIVVTAVSSHSVRIRGASTSWSYATIDAESRRRLVEVDSDGKVRAPLSLWLTEDGRPLSAATWQSAFRRANQRCAALAQDFRAGRRAVNEEWCSELR